MQGIGKLRSMTNTWNTNLLDRFASQLAYCLEGGESFHAADWPLAALREVPDEALVELVGLLSSLPLETGSASIDAALASLFHTLARRFQGAQESRTHQMSGELRAGLRRLFARLPHEGRAQAHLLQVLATARDNESLRTWVELMGACPPRESTLAAVVLGPLFQYRDYDPAPLFPRLLDTAAHPALAACVLDLANYLTRSGRMPVHPAADRQALMTRLLGDLAQRLSVLEELPDKPGESARVLAEQVEDAVGLAVSLCDALALIGDRAAVGKLYQAMELSHRRLRTEAAVALARLGEPAGTQMLLSLASHPVSRLRVLKYAEELQILDQVDPQYVTDTARAEAELALWLAQPTQLGIPSGKIELLDQRTFYWPGYEDPVSCFLFRFSYRLATAEYANIALVGPATHAFAADLADLSPDDIYAAFAGWQAEHEEIFETDYERLSETQRLEAIRLERRLHDRGYEEIQPVLLGSFFGEKSLIAQAKSGGTPCIAVVDTTDVISFRTARHARAIGPAEAYAIYKGRKLLRSFNPE